MVSVLGVFGACDFAAWKRVAALSFNVGNLYWWVTHYHASDYAPTVGRWWPNVKGLRRWEFLSLDETVPRQSLIVMIVSDSAGLHESYTELFTRTGQTVFTIFCFRKIFKITKLVPKCFIMSVDRTRSSRMLLVLARILDILSVAVVEFGTHTPCYWSETYHGVSMECWKICLISFVFDLI